MLPKEKNNSSSLR